MTRSSKALSVAVLLAVLTCLFCSGAVADSILVANSVVSRIEAFGIDGKHTGSFFTAVQCPPGPNVVLQGGDGNIYVGTADSVHMYGPDQTPIATPLIYGPAVADLAWKDDMLWAATADGLTAAYDVWTGAQSGPSMAWPSGADPAALKFGPDGRAYVALRGTGEVWAWDTAAGTTQLIASPGGILTSLAWNGNELYINRSDTGQIYKWTQAGGLVAWGTAAAGSFGIAIRGDKLYATVPGALNTYNLADGSLLYFGFVGGSELRQVCVYQMEMVETPTFSPDGGVYSTAQTVTIECATSGASIHYTTDGTEPTEYSTAYSGPITVDHNMRLQARAFKTGAGPSAIKSANYVVGPQPRVILAAGHTTNRIEKFTLDGIYVGPFVTGLASAPIGIVQGGDGNIYVGTTTGVTKYGPDASLINAELISTSAWVTDLAWKDGKLWLTTYDGLTSAYDPVTGGQTGPAITWPADAGASTNPYGLAFGPDGRCYVCFLTTGDVWAWDTTTGETELVISTGGDRLSDLQWVGDELWIGGNNGTISKWSEYLGLLSWIEEPPAGIGIAVSGDTLFGAVRTTLRTFRIYDGVEINSSECPSDYLQQICFADVSDGGMVEKPTLAPAGGWYESAQNVAISCATAGATIRYTTDGSDPTAISQAYTGPVLVDHDLTLKARAYNPGQTPSEIAKADYSIGPRSEFLLITCYDLGSVERVTLDGTYAGRFATRSGPVAVLQGGDGNVYIGGAGGVGKYSQDGTVIKFNFVTGLGLVTDLAWHDNKLWVTDWSGSTAAYNATTGAQSGPSTTITGNPYGIKFGPDGLAYVVTFMSGELVTWDTATGAKQSIATPGGSLGGLVWNGNDLYIAANGSVVYKWTQAGGAVAWAYGAPSSIGITVYGDKLFRVASNPSEIEIFSLADASTLYTGPGQGSQMQQICILNLPVNPLPITEIKGLADGKTAACENVAVTAVFTDCFYVEDADRVSGIQVRTPGTMPTVDALISVKGIVKTDAATGERYIDATMTQPSGTQTIDPVGVTNKNLGGGPAGLQAGIEGASGVNNIGLLVKTTGKVVSPEADVFYLDDGSGVTVKVTSGTVYATGSYVDVTGISSCETVSGKLSRVIRALTVNKVKDP